MHKLFAAITFAFLLGVTLAGCEGQRLAELQKPAPLWDKIAERGSE